MVFTPTTTMSASGDISKAVGELSKAAGAIGGFAKNHPLLTAGAGAVAGAGITAKVVLDVAGAIVDGIGNDIGCTFDDSKACAAGGKSIVYKPN